MELGGLIGKTIIVSFVGGILHLDRTAAFQFLISRPIVSSCVVGLLMGDVTIGIKIGMILELLWLGIQPLGTSLPPDDTIVAVAAPAAAIITGRLMDSMEIPLISLSVLVSLPLSVVGRLLDERLRKQNGVFLKRAIAAAENGDIHGVERQNMAGFGSFLLFFSLFSAVGIACVCVVIRALYPYLPEAVMRALTWIFWSLPFFGVGAVLGRQEGVLTFTVIYLLSYAVLVFFVGGI